MNDADVFSICPWTTSGSTRPDLVISFVNDGETTSVFLNVHNVYLFGDRTFDDASNDQVLED